MSCWRPGWSPAVLSAHAIPAALPAAGGAVQVTGTVRNAASCQLVLLSRQSFPVVYSHNPTTACNHGSFSAHVTIGANPSGVKRTVAFALVARNGPFSFSGTVLCPAGAPAGPGRPVGPRRPGRSLRPDGARSSSPVP